MENAALTVDFDQPRDRVFTWFMARGANARMVPPGWAHVLTGDPDSDRVGNEFTVKPSHPLLEVVPGLRRIPTGVAKGQLTGVDPNNSIIITASQGTIDFTQQTIFEDTPAGGTRVTTRFAGSVPEPALKQGLKLLHFLNEQATADLTLMERLGWPEPRRIVVAGSSGLVGTQLVGLLQMAGHHVVRLVRGAPSGPDEAQWDPTRHQLPASLIEDADVVVNLAGHTIGGRFTEENKRLILDSRVQSTTTLARALAAAPAGKTLVQASAVGIYGARRPGELLTEESERGDGFLADVVAAWEQAAAPVVEAGVRTVFVRTGIALSYGGGALQRQIPLYLVGAGGRLGAADHVLSWIDLDDLVRAYVHAICTPSLSGPVNAVAPNPVTNVEFADTLGRVLKRPSILPTPSFGPKLLLGGEGYDQLIDTDQRVSAEKLEDSGFEFAYPALEGSLRHTLLRG